MLFQTPSYRACFRRLLGSSWSKKAFSTIPKKAFSTIPITDICSSSQWSETPGFLGQYTPQDNKNIKVVLLDAQKDEAAWEEYNENMIAVYSKYGVYAEKQKINDMADTTLLALATCLESDEMIGGVRIEGPFPQLDQIFGIQAIRGFKNSQQVIDRIEKFCFSDKNNVVMENRGMWAKQKGISNALARAMRHLGWFTNSTYVTVFAPLHTLESYKQIGFDFGTWFDAENPDLNPSFPYPNATYKTYHMIMAPHCEALLDQKTCQMVRYEQRALAHEKEQYWNQYSQVEEDNTNLREKYAQWGR